MIFRYNNMLNAAFARVFAVSSALAIVLWSASILRSRALSAGVGIYGCVLGAIVVIGVFSGLLNPDAHGFGLLIFGEAIWFISSGALLWQVKEA